MRLCLQYLNLHELANDTEYMGLFTCVEGHNGKVPKDFDPVLELFVEEYIDVAINPVI
jgi:hypothetical protein